MNNAAVATLILDKFEQQVRSDILSLENSVNRQDLNEVARITHALKGAAGAVAATSLHECAKALEDHARQGHLECLASGLALLHYECDRCLRALPAARSAFIVVAERDAIGRKAAQ
jgi:HPt (histidine-containing phosphotransfer) domain-containing protein